jgi:mxaD protein
MATFTVEVHIDASPDAVWAVVGDPCGVTRWYPLYTGCRIDGDVRVLTRADGVELTERMFGRDDAGMTYSYSVTAGLPLASHEASFTVVPDGEGSRVLWRTSAEHEDPSVDMEARLRDRQAEALEQLRTYVEGAAPAPS